MGTAASLPVCVVSDQLRGSVSSLLQTVARDEDMSWARREQQALGRVPSRGERVTVPECDNSLTTSEAKQNHQYFPQQHSIKIDTAQYICFMLINIFFVPSVLPPSSTVSPPQPFSLQLRGGISGSGWRESHESPGVSPLLLQPQTAAFQQGRDRHRAGPGAT